MTSKKYDIERERRYLVALNDPAMSDVERCRIASRWTPRELDAMSPKFRDRITHLQNVYDHLHRERAAWMAEVLHERERQTLIGWLWKRIQRNREKGFL